MIKTFIDTNIFLDILCKREKFVDDALSIFDMAVDNFRPIFTIVPLGTDVIDKALDLRANDFEDALQYFSAVQANADCLVTRNIKDYGFAKMEVLNSQTFLAKYK